MNWVQRFVFVSSLLLAGCADTIDGKSIAEPEVGRFHERLNAHAFKQIYESASPEFKNATPEVKTLALFEAIDRKLGPFQGTKEVNWRVNTSNLATTISLVYETKFQEGDATETFTFRIKDKVPELVSYNIASLDMLIK